MCDRAKDWWREEAGGETRAEVGSERKVKLILNIVLHDVAREYKVARMRLKQETHVFPTRCKVRHHQWKV